MDLVEVLPGIKLYLMLAFCSLLLLTTACTPSPRAANTPNTTPSEGTAVQEGMVIEYKDPTFTFVTTTGRSMIRQQNR